jgi:hypothetical protein
VVGFYPDLLAADVTTSKTRRSATRWQLPNTGINGMEKLGISIYTAASSHLDKCI